jgi:phosphoribosylformylglycinamidine cyclo-ligase
MRLKPESRIEGLKHSVGAELLRVHQNYQPLLSKMPPGMIHGLAHITGGGLIDNLPRVLPGNCNAVIDTKSWRVPVIFEFLQRHGKVDRTEMFQVFNMGIGMAVVVAAKNSAKAIALLKAKPIGQIERGRGQTRLLF